jgi:hypothetical protein
MLTLYLGSKGANYESLLRYVSDPNSVQLLRIAPPTPEEIKEKTIKNDRSFGQALMLLAGKKKKTISRSEFRRKYGV